MEITLEKIELVKDRTGVTYKDAKQALENSGRSIVDAIIEIEESINHRSAGKKGLFTKNEKTDKVDSERLLKIKEAVLGKAEKKLKEGFKFILSNSQPNYDKIGKYKEKYAGNTNDFIALRMVEHTSKMAGLNGMGGGAAITTAELSSAINAPAGVAITAATILEDFCVTTKLQLQLMVDVVALYGCEFNLDDEEDALIILLMAIGVKKQDELFKSLEKIINEAGIKNLRKLLRYKLIRNKVQEKVAKAFGKEAAKKLAEKQLLKLVPVASIILSGELNKRAAKNVGKSAMRYGKIRSAMYKHVEDIERISSKYSNLILYTLRYITDFYEKTKVIDDFAMVWRCTTPKLHITEELINEVEECEDIKTKFPIILSEIDNDDIKKLIYNVAETTIATGKPNEAKKYLTVLQEMAKIMGLEYNEEHFMERLQYFNKSLEAINKKI